MIKKDGSLTGVIKLFQLPKWFCKDQLSKATDETTMQLERVDGVVDKNIYNQFWIPPETLQQDYPLV